MNTKRIITAVSAVVITIAAGWFLWPKAVAQRTITIVPQAGPSAAELDLKHRQETWISALEWCESRAKNDALNPKDRDGTPSYSNFQWKPTTLLSYGKQYGLISASSTLADVSTLLKDYDLQRNVVRQMIADPAVNWYQQFPDCVKTKVGLPPKK